MDIFEIVLKGVQYGSKYGSIFKIKNIMYDFLDYGMHLNYYQLNCMRNDLYNLSDFVESQEIKNAVAVFIDNPGYSNAKDVLVAIRLFGPMELFKDGYPEYAAFKRREENERRIAAQQRTIEHRSNENDK